MAFPLSKAYLNPAHTMTYTFFYFGTRTDTAQESDECTPDALVLFFCFFLFLLQIWIRGHPEGFDPITVHILKETMPPCGFQTTTKIIWKQTNKETGDNRIEVVTNCNKRETLGRIELIELAGLLILITSVASPRRWLLSNNRIASTQ